MDFRSVLSTLLKRFDDENIGYALMGGFALGLWGAGRSTVDLDFLVRRDDMDKAGAIMFETGYEVKYKSDDVTQFISPLKVFGEVDFLHAFREASGKMLDRAVEKDIFDEKIRIKVLRPEDIIGLKLQALNNDPGRKEVDMQDVRELMAVQKGNLDLVLVEEYFNLFGLEEVYRELIEQK